MTIEERKNQLEAFRLKLKFIQSTEEDFPNIMQDTFSPKVVKTLSKLRKWLAKEETRLQGMIDLKEAFDRGERPNLKELGIKISAKDILEGLDEIKNRLEEIAVIMGVTHDDESLLM